MKFLGKSGKAIAWLLLGITPLIHIYLVCVVWLGLIPVNSGAVPGDDVTIYIKTNGVHTDIVVPVRNGIKDWSREIRYDQTAGNDSLATYLAFGWGDRGFYINTAEWADLTAETTFVAAFYLGTSVVHTEFHRGLRESENCRKITISTPDYQSLVDYISASFRREDGQVVWIPETGYGKSDTFYEGAGKYSLFKTCNTWANAGLKAANQKAALWTATDTGICYHYD